MCALADGSNVRLKIGQTISIILFLITLISYDVLSVYYFVEHLHLNDIVGSIYALGQALPNTVTTISYIILIYLRKSVRSYFDKIQDMLDRCN